MASAGTVCALALLLVKVSAEDRCAKYREFQVAWDNLPADGRLTRRHLAKYDPRKLSTSDLQGCASHEPSTMTTGGAVAPLSSTNFVGEAASLHPPNWTATSPNAGLLV